MKDRRGLGGPERSGSGEPGGTGKPGRPAKLGGTGKPGRPAKLGGTGKPDESELWTTRRRRTIGPIPPVSEVGSIPPDGGNDGGDDVAEVGPIPPVYDPDEEDLKPHERGRPNHIR